MASGSKETFVAPFEEHFTTDSVSRAGRGPTSVTRTPIPFFGAGLLDEIPADEIASRADPNDADGDGISGKVNFERGFIGRFGRKAQMASLQSFVRLALVDHLGVTSLPVKTPWLLEEEMPAELPTADEDAVSDPEISQGDLSDLLAFVGLLAPPPPDPPNDTTRAGAALFRTVGCEGCHVPALRGPRGAVRAYTDLLLHDMGPELADGVVVGSAKGGEFRTQPLWGIAAGGPYLHDGRADTIDEAIVAHGGEGAGAAHRYEALASSDREQIVAFLRSLGGSDRRPDGLLPRDAPSPARDELGGPGMALSSVDAERFARGRELFDHDFSRKEGLGPRFNGDACRSCHFDPVLGGAGPSDVDAVRYGFALDDGSFRPPSSGETLAQRFLLGSGRPSVDVGANLFERRQTPALFGLGLLDAISEDVLRARADPDDRDGDGIRGVPSLLPDGRIGRFGWKAQAATLEDFVRDAFEHELGVTPPSIAGGAGELASGAFADVTFFIAALAPPPRRALGSGEEAQGRDAFERFACSGCHTPELATRDGRQVALFSDLLLHDVGSPSTRFVSQGSSRTFRTPPLWGIAHSAPYLHDGSAETLDAAIRRHDSEALRSRDRYLVATDADRAALIAFLQAL
jgi:CxxC motif-containing protein (DUF1111 family)